MIIYLMMVMRTMRVTRVNVGDSYDSYDAVDNESLIINTSEDYERRTCKSTELLITGRVLIQQNAAFDKLLNPDSQRSRVLHRILNRFMVIKTY
jgi:hypothetical protein